MRDLDEFEDGLVERFRAHPVLTEVAALPDEAFHAILLQRRFISLAFTPAYDLAIDLLRDEVGLRIARIILREEYPDTHGTTRSHREDMKEDILRLGVPREQLVASRPSETTARVIKDTFDLIAEAGAHEDSDLMLLTLLRFWGEVLVSVEYGALWPRMAPVFTQDGRNRSRFYYPHYIHDAKGRPLATTSLLSTTHSDRLATRLSELLAHEESPEDFKRMEERALGLKVDFYEQFRG
ncbi:hypothetical protein HUT18_20750 [Streptomyces sp. NA04227]|uniref:hypothetical protein n=1 Tax=Streptomyces sp. NA04227 TaxID=2742136 RepID=UPI0015909587|nr:hypothetical protein [Streptomyces sp. NA04227]QKW08440.1 hypothetical protein HUT18_20750 [Streptomyces sp. NA04227]